jgi:serine/threonine-protein kinase HipA
LIKEGQTRAFSPAYDLINSSIVLNAKEELALPLRGKESHFTRADLIDYYGMERLQLNAESVKEVLNQIQGEIGNWKELIRISFLSEKKKKAYLNLLEERIGRIFNKSFAA